MRHVYNLPHTLPPVECIGISTHHLKLSQNAQELLLKLKIN